MRRLVEQDHVIALFGTFGGTTGAAVIPYLEQKKVPMVGGESVARVDADLAAIHPVRRIQANELGRGAAIGGDIDQFRRHLASVEQQRHAPSPGGPARSHHGSLDAHFFRIV